MDSAYSRWHRTKPKNFLNKQVIVKGYLGTLASHIHTSATIEAKEIYDDTQKMD